ncbi:MAG: hypothetical protein RR442_05495, partial [Muribaculaceae bacterium]
FIKTGRNYFIYYKDATQLLEITNCCIGDSHHSLWPKVSKNSWYIARIGYLLNIIVYRNQ